LVHKKHCKKLASARQGEGGDLVGIYSHHLFDNAKLSDVPHEALIMLVQKVLLKIQSSNQPVFTKVQSQLVQLWEVMKECMEDVWAEKKIFPGELREFYSPNCADFQEQTVDIVDKALTRQDLWRTLHLVLGRLFDNQCVYEVNRLKNPREVIPEELWVGIQQEVGPFPSRVAELIKALSGTHLPKAGAWLNCSPLPALGLHLRGAEFVVACKFRLGLAVYDQAGACASCGKESDILGDHSMVCGRGGERIVRHNAIRDALHETAAAAGLAPLKEGRALLPGNNRRPADVFIPHWAAGLDAALDVTVTHPLQDATRARAATTPGHAMKVAFDNKCRVTEDLCREQGIAFIPIVAESLGGWHKIALEQFSKLGSALGRHTGQEEGEKVDHLIKRVSILLQKGLASMLLNRIPGHAAPEVDGVL